MNSVARIARMAERYGIPVAMHNHARVHPNEFATPDDFAKAIDTDGDTILDARAGRTISATVEAALESGRTGSPVTVT